MDIGPFPMYRGSGAGGHQVDLVDGNLTWLNAARPGEYLDADLAPCQTAFMCVRGRGACDDAQAAVCVPRTSPHSIIWGDHTRFPPIIFHMMKIFGE